MAIRFRVIKAKNSLYYGSIVSSFRDEITKKPTTKSLKSYGHVTEEKLNDPSFKAQVRHDIKYFCDQLSSKSYTKDKADKSPKFSHNYLYYAFLPLLKVYKSLNLDVIFKTLERDAGIEDISTLIFYMVAMRIFDEEWDIQKIDNRHIFDFNDVNINTSASVLTYLASSAFLLSRPINKELYDKNIIDNTDITYYLTKFNFQHIKNNIKKQSLIENQCVLGLMLDKNDIPLDYHLEQVSLNERLNRDDLFKRVLYVKKTFAKYSNFTLIADTELNKKGILYSLEKEQLNYILISNMYKLSSRRRAFLLDGKFKKGHSDDGDNSWRYKQIQNPLFIKHGKRRIVANAKVYVIYSKHKRAHDLWRLEKQWRAALNLVNMSDSILNSTGLFDDEVLSSSLMRFIKTKSGTISADNNVYSKYGVLGGYFIVVTNLDDDIDSIYSRLKKLWEYKETYRNPSLPNIKIGNYLSYKDLMAGHFYLANLSNILKRALLKILKDKNLNISLKQLQKALLDSYITFLPKNNFLKEPIVVKNTNMHLDKDGMSLMDNILKALDIELLDSVDSIKHYKAIMQKELINSPLKLKEY